MRGRDGYDGWDGVEQGNVIRVPVYTRVNDRERAKEKREGEWVRSGFQLGKEGIRRSFRNPLTHWAITRSPPKKDLGKLQDTKQLSREMWVGRKSFPNTVRRTHMICFILTFLILTLFLSFVLVSWQYGTSTLSIIVDVVPPLDL